MQRKDGYVKYQQTNKTALLTNWRRYLGTGEVEL